jgi:hypothetical protein
MRKLLLAVLSLLLSLGMAEAVLRIAGHWPYSEPVAGDKITAVPGPMFCPDSVYGYTSCAGRFDVTLNGSLTYRLTIDSADRSRQLPDTIAAPGDSLREVHVHGCSFFAGMGVNDDEVLSARLQSLLGKHHRVVNRAIPGHGMTTQLRQLQQSIAQGRVPQVAVFSLASFHLHRNPGAADYLTRFHVIKDRPMQFLCSELDSDGRVRFFIKDVGHNLLPGARQSALLHLLGNTLINHSGDQEAQLRLQLALMDSAHALAAQHGVFPMFMVITDDGVSDRIAQHAEQHGYALLRSSVDFNNTDYNLMPHDGHPNARAHGDYAHEMYAMMAHRDLTSSPKSLFQDHVR